MGKIDFSWLTSKDLDEIMEKAQAAGFETADRIDRNGLLHFLCIIIKFLVGEEEYDLTVCLSCSNEGKEHGIFLYGKSSNGALVAIAHEDFDTYLPSSIALLPKEIPFNGPDRVTVDKHYSIFKESPGLFQKAYDKIISLTRAPSKEDFYDDVTDYQDDEPTDLGDASNYDENLVRRIRKLID